MRIPETCKICCGPAIVFCSVRGSMFTTRYRRCRNCGKTSKSVSVNPFLFGSDFSHSGPTIVNNAGVDSFTSTLERKNNGTG